MAGLAGIGHETILAKADRPSLLFVFAAMVGLPAFLRSDEKGPGPPPEPPRPLPDLPAPPRPLPPGRTTVKRPRVGR